MFLKLTLTTLSVEIYDVPNYTSTLIRKPTDWSAQLYFTFCFISVTFSKTFTTNSKLHFLKGRSTLHTISWPFCYVGEHVKQAENRMVN